MWFRSRSRWARRVHGLCTVGILAVVGYVIVAPSTYSVNPGSFADEPRCSEVVSRLPETLLGEHRDRTTGAGTAAWGDASVVLRCGVQPPAPTTNVCLTVDGVDWVLDEHRAERDGVRVLTTYGRAPAVEVRLRDDQQVAAGALAALTGSIKTTSQDDQGECTSLNDVH